MAKKVLTLTPPYKKSYLRTIGNQLSTMLSHKVRHCNLPSNPMSEMNRMWGHEDRGGVLF